VITLEALNECSQSEFAASLAGIFEHSAWVAHRAAEHRPFLSRLQLLDSMRAVVQAASEGEQLALIRAHPHLGAGRSGNAALTALSAHEQRSAGLDACTQADFVRLERLNAEYLKKFGFPFILAVRGRDPAAIIARFEQRLRHTRSLELSTALAEIALIAGYRLADGVASAAGVEIMAMIERMGQGSSPVREWMLAAGLELRLDSADVMIGFRPGSGPEVKTLLLGVHFDPTTNTVRYDGRLGFIIAIAVSQRFRQQNIRTPFALAVMARPCDQRAGDVPNLGDPQAMRGCVALGAVDSGVDARQTQAALSAAGLDQHSLAIVRQGEDGLLYRERAPLDANAAERAAGTLADFLLQTQRPIHYHG
jgi:OHCU decarboxylase